MTKPFNLSLNLPPHMCLMCCKLDVLTMANMGTANVEVDKVDVAGPMWTRFTDVLQDNFTVPYKFCLEFDFSVWNKK